MDIKVITRHGPSNYGSLLQAIATQSILESAGHRAEIIDYQRDDERGLSMILTQVNNKEKFLNPVKRIIYISIRYPMEILTQHKFDEMRRKWLQMTPRCRSRKDLESLSADLFVTGSDQVWGPVMNGDIDTAYLLSFVHKSAKKLSFSSSFGRLCYRDDVRDLMVRLLKEYNQITVREDSAVALLDQWGVKNCIGRVLDPTLILSADQWRSKINIPCRKHKHKYILLYLVHNHPEHSRYAKRLAKIRKQQLIRVNPYMHQCFSGGKFVWCPDLAEFLSLINDAEMIVTDSFHGTCFAINFNKQFVELLPQNDTGTRNISILSLTGLSRRVVQNFDNFTIDNIPIDYDHVNKLIAEERKKSLQILFSMLEKADCNLT